jgi:hypothetical protein
MIEALANTASWMSTAARAGHARAPGNALGARPELPLILYEYEACPMCRRVREALTDLALPVEIRPCPRGGERFRPEAIARAGKRQFPFLVDPNTGDELLDSDRIVAHLYATYGEGDVPSWLTAASFPVTSTLASVLRGAAGARARRSEGPTSPVELRSNESDPKARRVREVLCELEIPYVRTAGALRLRDPESGTVHEEPSAAIAWLVARFDV